MRCRASTFISSDDDIELLNAHNLAMETVTPIQASALASLSRAEREVLDQARFGRTAAEIAEELSVSLATVRTHLSHIYDKLGVHGRVELLVRLEAAAALPPPNNPLRNDLVSSPSADPGSNMPAAGKRPIPDPVERLLPWALGGVSGLVAGAAIMPIVAYWHPAAALLLLVLCGFIAATIARRPGGLAFLAPAAGVAGAILVALAASVPMSCPAGAFSSGCTYPILAPFVLPGIALMIVGTLLARRAAHARTPD
jgi:DNA-binding CsgD family transcriptional regulator